MSVVQTIRVSYISYSRIDAPAATILTRGDASAEIASTASQALVRYAVVHTPGRRSVCVEDRFQESMNSRRPHFKAHLAVGRVSLNLHDSKMRRTCTLPNTTGIIDRPS